MTSRGLLLTALLFTAACGPERLRPGPPSVTIEGPAGSTVFSPDTVLIAVMVTDPNGLDSIVVTFADTTISISTRADVEAIGVFAWPIHAGFNPGDVLAIEVWARDLTLQITTARQTVTVIARP